MERRPNCDRPIVERRQAAIVCVFLLLAVGLVFCQTVRYGFVNFDDGKYVAENPHISRGFSAKGIAWVFTHSHVGNWHPLTGLSHMLDCQLFGLDAGWHHLVNVLLHAAATVLLFLLLWRMTGRLWPGAMAAALFAVHPLHVESVAWIAERKDVLSGLLFMLTLAAYVGYASRPFSLVRYSAVILLFALGLMAKPMLVTLPLVLLLLDYWPLGRMNATESSTASREERPSRFCFPSRLLIEKLPLFLLAAVCCVITVYAQESALAASDRLPFGSRAANALVSYVAYVGRLFFPVELAVFYPHPGAMLPVWKLVGSIVVLVCISAVAAACWRRYPYVLIGWLWYLGMLVPVIGLVQVGSQAMADRYTYLPQIGLYVALVWAAADACRSWSCRRAACGIVSVLVLATLMGCAWRQASFWRDDETLWTHTVACTSRNHWAHVNLGLAMNRLGRSNEAIANYRMALQINPNDALALSNLGSFAAGAGRFDEAAAYYRKAMQSNPNFANAHNNLGNVLFVQGRPEAAIVEYRKALELNPDSAEYRNSLGNCLMNLGRFGEAATCYREALEVQSDSVAVLRNLAWLRATCPVAALRNGAEAISLAEQANQLTGGKRPQILDVLAAAYAEAGRFPEALATARQALRLAAEQNHRNLAKALQARIALYEAGKPFHQRAAVSAPGRPAPKPGF